MGCTDKVIHSNKYYNNDILKIQHFFTTVFVLRYFADEYGYVRGAVNMKKEIMKRGPIGKYFNIFFLKNIFASKSLFYSFS